MDHATDRHCAALEVGASGLAGLSSLDQEPARVGDEGSVASYLSVEFAQLVEVLLNCEAGNHLDHLAQEVDDSTDIEEFQAQSLEPEVDHLETGIAGIGTLVLVVPTASGLRLGAEKVLD